MKIKECILGMWKEIIFAVVMVIYLSQLHSLNKELNICNFDDAFALLEYKEWMPVKFFLVAVLLFLIGCLLIYGEARYWRRQCNSFEEMIIVLLTIIIMVGLLILLIIFINNPILKAILTACLGICGFISAKA